MKCVNLIIPTQKSYHNVPGIFKPHGDLTVQTVQLIPSIRFEINGIQVGPEDEMILRLSGTCPKIDDFAQNPGVKSFT